MSDKDHIDFGVEHRIKERRQYLVEQFIEYVIEQAGEQIVVEDWSRDVTVDVANRLHSNGYDIRGVEEQEVYASLYAAPEPFYDISHDIQQIGRFDRKELTSPGAFKFQTVEHYIDQSIPDGTAIAVHHHAIAPNVPGDINRPWLVKHPDGVVVVRDRLIDGDTDE